MEKIIKSFLDKHDFIPVGIGLAIPGLLSKDGEVVSCDVLPQFKGWNANLALTKFSPVVKAVNDVKAAFFQEFNHCGSGYTGGLIMVGTAVGAAFIVNGKILSGASGWAGEFGYFPLVVDGEIKRIDTLCGGSFLAQKLGISAKEMADLAIEGDEFVRKEIDKAGYFLGIGIAGLINLFNPERISIGGGTVDLPGYWKGILKGARENSIPEFWADDLLIKVKDGPKVAALGAMTLL